MSVNFYPNLEELTSSSSFNGAVATGSSSLGASEATTGASSLCGSVASSLEISSEEVGIPSFFLGLKMSPIRAESRR